MLVSVIMIVQALPNNSSEFAHFPLVWSETAHLTIAEGCQEPAIVRAILLRFIGMGLSSSTHQVRHINKLVRVGGRTGLCTNMASQPAKEESGLNAAWFSIPWLAPFPPDFFHR